MIISRRKFKFSSIGAGASRSQAMTLLEVLIAILLFAVFVGTFLVVTEMLAKLLPFDVAVEGDQNCSGPALEEACVNVALDAMIPRLEKYDPSNLDVGGRYQSPSQMFFAGISDLRLSWPDAYTLEIIGYPELEQSAATTTNASLPGLYVIQAIPARPAFWRKPIQRLFCRPYHRCVR